MEKQESGSGQWEIVGSLFGALSEDFLRGLELLPKAIEKVWHIPAQKRKNLPEDISALSQLLTRGRADLDLPYWHKAANVSAYLYYFLPWNIIRLGKLFSALPLPVPQIEAGCKPLLLDMGSGPLALPIALWLAKRDWRALPLRILACDTAKQPMELGRDIFNELALLMGERAWQSHLHSAPAHKAQSAFQIFQSREEDDKIYPWLLCEANILNELLSKNPERKEYDEADSSETGTDCEASLLGRLLSAWLPVWKKSPARALALFVEPGTRLGGDAIMNLRRCALELDFQALAPCTHDNGCPLLGKTRKHGSQAESWCHFTFSALGAPDWLKKLSHEAGLEKKSLSLSMLLLGEQHGDGKKENFSRVISRPFPVPDLAGQARYACGHNGLQLLENAGYPESGSLTRAQSKKPAQRDKKSGAMVCVPVRIGGNNYDKSKKDRNRS